MTGRGSRRLSESLLINVMPDEIRAAAVDDGQVVELFIERKRRRSLIGDIYLGRVERILPGMDAAFVDIGIGRAGFLGIDGAQAPNDARDGTARIGDHVLEGQAVRVQITKDAVGRKGVQLTRRVTLAGRHLVLAPLQSRIAVSRQIEDEAERERLQGLVEATAEPGEGFIIRTASVGAGAEELARDAAYLRALWADIETRQAGAAAPALLHEDLSPLLRLFRDRVSRTTALVRIDSPDGFAAAGEFCATFMPEMTDRLALHPGPEPIFDDADVEAEIERALGARIELPSGVEIVIEATEALTAIDVNSGRFTGSGRLEDTAYATNLDAASEAARQIRLRNIGGLIVIDFIHMDEDAHWVSVLERLSGAFAGDRNNVRVMGRTASGLVEVTRRRQRESLAQTMTEPCPGCGGNARVESIDTLALEVMRALKREARSARPGALVVMASTEIVERLEQTAGGALGELEAIIGRRIRLDREPSYPRGSFDIMVDDPAGH